MLEAQHFPRLLPKNIYLQFLPKNISLRSPLAPQVARFLNTLNTTLRVTETENHLTTWLYLQRMTSTL